MHLKIRNSLYRDFIRKKTKEAKDKYKIYKNKLTNILRNSKKEYYKKMIKMVLKEYGTY